MRLSLSSWALLPAIIVAAGEVLNPRPFSVESIDYGMYNLPCSLHNASVQPLLFRRSLNWKQATDRAGPDT